MAQPKVDGPAISGDNSLPVFLCYFVYRAGVQLGVGTTHEEQLRLTEKADAFRSLAVNLGHLAQDTKLSDGDVLELLSSDDHTAADHRIILETLSPHCADLAGEHVETQHLIFDD